MALRRATLNFAVDAAAFACFVLLASSGVLLRYLLPPGSGHRTTLLGLDRHGWGSVHFWIAAVFLGTLAVHVALHARFIVGVLRRRPAEGSGARAALGLVGLAAVVALALAPLLAPTVRTPRGSHAGRGFGGSATLRDVEEITGVPAAELAARLGLPRDVSPDTPLAALSHEYGFRMGDVRRALRPGGAGPPAGRR